ncbi:MAG: TIGR02466 family protein [Parvularcula sp.]
MSDLKMRQWFAVPVWEVKIPDFADLNKEILTHLDEVKAEKPGIQRSNAGGWHSHDRLHHDPRFSAVRDHIAAHCHACATEIGFDHDTHDLVLNEMWLNQTGPGDYNSPHVHPNSFLSGVYYVKVPEGGGNIEFSDPAPARTVSLYPRKKDNIHASPKIVYGVRTGMLLVFPSWLQHGVLPNQSNKPRISISFNVGYRSKPVS